ncbi:MAG: hypothetical protein J7M15_05330 [Anaerolineae bacterium]|nr:hypothetical protein [Anaerolineae bacterium]
MQSKRPFGKAWLRRAVPVTLVVLGLLVTRVYVMQIVELVRLRAWRDELVAENTELERQVADLSFELDRRGTDAWVVEQLHAMGLVGPDEVRVRAVPMTAVATPTVTPVFSANLLDEPQAETLFHNKIWEAWKDLLLGEQGPRTEAASPPPKQ